MSNKMWNISEHDISESSSLNEKIRFWLRYAILAPSAHNTQPWKFNIEDSILKVERDIEHTLKQGDPTLRETTLSIGACIENFCIAAAHWKYRTQVNIKTQTIRDTHIADILISPGDADERIANLFSGIQKRHTNRGEYESSPLEEEIINSLKIPTPPETQIFFITDPEPRKRIAKLVGRGTVIALGMPSMQRELAELVSRVSENLDTGMVVEALTESPYDGQTGKDWVLESLDPEEQAKTWEETFLTSPLHIIIGTLYDGPEAWIDAGRTMERILVAAAQHELTHCIAAAPVEIPTLTPDLRQEIPPEFRPQVLVRIGRPKNKAYTVESGRRQI